MPLLWACFFGAVGVSSILTDQSGYHWVTAWLFELLAIGMVLGWWGKRAHIAQLAAEVERCAVRQT
jgi:protein-S-isoprenylcysteine O-methyltransferase Ste14